MAEGNEDNKAKITKESDFYTVANVQLEQQGDCRKIALNYSKWNMGFAILIAVLGVIPIVFGFKHFNTANDGIVKGNAEVVQFIKTASEKPAIDNVKRDSDETIKMINSLIATSVNINTTYFNIGVAFLVCGVLFEIFAFIIFYSCRLKFNGLEDYQDHLDISHRILLAYKMSEDPEKETDFKKEVQSSLLKYLLEVEPKKKEQSKNSPKKIKESKKVVRLFSGENDKDETNQSEKK